MANKISKSTMRAIEVHLERNLRELTHFLYSPCSPEKFLREYYLRACYEEGPEEALAIDLMLYHEFGIDIDDLVSRIERDDTLEKGGWFK